MAEEIVQRLGFETGDTIANINVLRSALESLNTSLAASATAIRQFSGAGGGLDKALADLTGKVDLMAKQMQTGFNNIKPPQLTFDTSAALNQVNQLTAAWGRISSTAPNAFKQQFASMKASLADYVNQNKISKDQVIQAFAGTLSGSTPAISGLKTRVDELKNAFTSVANTAQISGSRIGSFFSQLGRIVAFRAVISTLNDVSQGMQEGVTSAADFSQRIGQIGAIMDDTSLSLGTIRQELLATSAEFARPIGETSLAFYQTMQNQVGTAAESLDVFTQAAKLSAANNAPLNDSVNLITSALKGWNLEASEAGRLAGMFFQAIKIGRMDASDLANTIGRLGPTAREMGISVEEAMGSVAIMTQQGVGADTAITQLSAVMTALIKPTKALKEVMLQKWGVENAEDAILKFGGLMGVLRQLEALTGGTSDEMVKFTANVRAVRGEMGLLGPNADAADAAIKSLKDSTVETADAASKMVLSTPGAQYKKSLVELSNAWTEMGERLLSAGTLLNEFKVILIDSISSSTVVVAALSGVAIAGVIALKTYASAMAAAALATTNLGKAAALANPVMAAFLTGMAIGQAIEALWTASKTNMKEYFDEVEKRIKDQTDITNKAIDTQTKVTLEGYRKRLQTAVDSISEINRLLNSEYVDAVKRSEAVILDVVKRRFNSILELERNQLQKSIASQADAAKKIDELKSGMATRGGSIADKEFNNNLGRWSQERQAQQQLMRGDQLRSQALSKLTSAKTPEDLKLVDELLTRSQSYYNASASGAENDRMALLAKTRSVQIDKDRNALDQKHIDLTKQAAAGASDQVGESQDLLTKTESLFKQYQDGLSEISKAKTPEELAAGVDKVKAAWAGLQQIITNQSPKAKDFLGLDKIHNEIVAQLRDLPNLNLKVTLDMAMIKAQLAVPMVMASPATQRVVGPSGNLDFAAAALEARKKLDEGIKKNAESIGEADKVGKELTAQLQEGTKAMPTGQNLDAYIAKLAGVAPSVKAPLDEIQLAVKRMLSTDPTDIDAFQRSLALFRTGIENFKAAMARMPESKKSLVDTIFKTSDFTTTLDNLKLNLTTKIQELDNLNPVQLKLEKKQFEDDIKTLDTELVPLKTSVNSMGNDATKIPVAFGATSLIVPAMSQGMTGVSATIKTASVNMIALKTAALEALAAIQAAASAAGGAAMTAAYGSPVYRAAGGPLPRWTDTRMAALTPGEVVVNASAAKQFYPQLQAMNGGAQPIFRDRGGPVTNVGDINVSVNGGETSQQTLKEIASGLRRGIQRKIIKLS